MVMYADDESFTLMTPQGHPLAGWITFSAATVDGVTVAQAQVLMRAQDPLSELGLSLGGHSLEDQFWQQTLGNLAAHLGVEPDTRDAGHLRRQEAAMVERGQRPPLLRAPHPDRGAATAAVFSLETPRA